jgi:hypothetical protein
VQDKRRQCKAPQCRGAAGRCGRRSRQSCQNPAQTLSVLNSIRSIQIQAWHAQSKPCPSPHSIQIPSLCSRGVLESRSKRRVETVQSAQRRGAAEGAGGGGRDHAVKSCPHLVRYPRSLQIQACHAQSKPCPSPHSIQILSLCSTVG